MYWSPIRTRLLVGMLTPAIRAKAITPVADFRVGRCVYVPDFPLQRPREHSVSLTRSDQHDVSTNATPPSKQGVVEEFFDWVRSIYGLDGHPSTFPSAFLRPGAGFSAGRPVGPGGVSNTAAISALTFSTDAIPSTVLSTPLQA